ncbi:MAG: tRNA (guanine-N7-)-methyltransferase [Gammaproteobacteria bacterium]|jgi:tRNA (guanine-N7-)-methyltransferase
MHSDSEKRHSIRSFVKRSGRLTISQQKAIDNHWPHFGIDYDIDPEKFSELLKSTKKVYLEIGIGNGNALIEMAKDNPTTLLIGIEVHEPGIGRCLNNIVNLALSNVRLFRHDAAEILDRLVNQNSLDRVMLFFPDPWHKKRHHKRRLVNAPFRDQLANKLKPGGIIHMATDWQDYADHMLEQFQNDDRFQAIGSTNGLVDRPEYRPLTHFEQRGIRLGHSVSDFMFAKR